MKKTLLLLAAVLLSSAAAFAQWTKPTLQTPDLQGQALVKDGTTEQYLYNVEKKAFFLGANDWQTRASVSDTLGALVKMVYEEETEAYRIYNYVYKFNEFRCMFADNQEAIWVDNNNGAHVNMWQFEEVDGGIFFKIYNDGLGKTEEAKEGLGYGYLSAPLSINDTRLYLTSWFLADETRGEAGANWMSVAPEAYDAYVAELKGTYAVYDAELARYNAAMALKAYLEKAAAEGNGADLSAEWAVYNDTTSSLEALQAALESATQKCVDWSAAQASVENPKDVSDMIENATFDVIGDFHGWSGTAFGAGGTTSTCAEHYSKNYDTYQDVNGGKDVPNGIYRVGVYGFYRAGSLDNDYATLGKAEYRNSKLYAYTPQDTLYTGVPALSTWAVEGSQLGGLQIGTTGLYVPNSMKEFTDWEDAGAGHEVELIVPVLDGKLRIGVKKDVLIDTDWSIFDNFRLTYYGNGLDAYQMWRDQVLETILADMQTYDWENMYYERAAKAEFEAAVVAARAATTPEEIHDLTVGITAIVERVLASISTYTELHDKWILWSEALQNYGGDLVSEFLEREEEVMNVLENGTMSTAEVRALIEELQAQYDYAIKHSFGEGDDVTNMITNPDFRDGKNGWTGEGTVTSNFFPNVENYDRVVDFKQTLTGVPAGLYSISVNAFERPAGNGSYTGDEESKVFLFMGDIQTPVQNICKDAVAPEDAQNEVNCYINDGQHADGEWPLDYNVEGYGYVPNSVTGASYAFQAGRYVQTCYGLVGEDGVMTIGLTSNGVKAHWVLWSNFKLTFEGKNLDGLKEALAPTMEGLEAWLAEQEDEMSILGFEAADARVAAVIDLYENGTSYEEVATIPAEVNAIKAFVAENKALVVSFRDAYAALEEALDTYSETAPAKLQDEAAALLDTAAESDPQEAEVTDDEVKAVIEQLNDMAAKLRVPDVEGASAENPIDMTQVIINPSFENGLNGWTNSGSIAMQTQTNTAFAKTDGTYCERWHATGTLDLNQEIRFLPVGFYALSADAYCSTGDGQLYAIVGADTLTVDIPDSGDATIKETFTVNFKVSVAGTKVVIGDKATLTNSTWNCVDNFTLSYTGNDDPTGIEAIENKPVAVPVVIYDLAGRRVAKAVKGIYIINGKKVVK